MFNRFKKSQFIKSGWMMLLVAVVKPVAIKLQRKPPCDYFGHWQVVVVTNSFHEGRISANTHQLLKHAQHLV